MKTLEQLHLEASESEIAFTNKKLRNELIASQSAQLTKDLMIEFALFLGTEVKIFADEWHYKEEAYSTHELLEIFLKQRYGNQD